MTQNIKFKIYGLWFVGVIAVMPHGARAGVIEDAVAKGYDAGFAKGYQKGFVEGQKTVPGGGTQNDIILSKSKDGGFGTGGVTTFMKKPTVGFLWDGKASTWSAYKLGGDASNTVTPGAGLPIGDWKSKPALLEKFGLDPKILTPQLKNLSKEFSATYPKSNIFIMPGKLEK